MPIYEYRCGGCEHQFEELIRNRNDETNVACPECASNIVHKMLSAFAVGRSRSAAPAPAACMDASQACGGCPGAAGLKN